LVVVIYGFYSLIKPQALGDFMGEICSFFAVTFSPVLDNILDDFWTKGFME